jgi:hypothetical protein
MHASYIEPNSALELFTAAGCPRVTVRDLAPQSSPPASAAPVSGADRAPDEVQALLNLKLGYSRSYVLVRLTGLEAARPRAASPGDTWEPLDNLTNCEAAITAFKQDTGRTLPRQAQPPPPASPGAAGASPYPSGRLHGGYSAALRTGRGAGGQGARSSGCQAMARIAAPSRALARCARSSTWSYTPD